MGCPAVAVVGMGIWWLLRHHPGEPSEALSSDEEEEARLTDVLELGDGFEDFILQTSAHRRRRR